MRRFPNCLTCCKWVGEPDQLEGCCVPLEYEPVSFQSSHLANLFPELQSSGGRIQVTNVVKDENWNWLIENWCVSEVPQEIMKCNYCMSWCNWSTWIAVIFHDVHRVPPWLPKVHGVQRCTRSTLITQCTWNAWNAEITWSTVITWNTKITWSTVITWNTKITWSTSSPCAPPTSCTLAYLPLPAPSLCPG